MASEGWKPGSFTKNFSWGEDTVGLSQLYENIRLGFAGELRDVPRDVYRQRVRDAGRPDYIPINFFLFNRQGRPDRIIVDELVFQALTAEHSPRFDQLALFAFNFSYVGIWSGQRQGQRRPALWALNYVRDRVASEFGWNAKRVSADDIERYVMADPRYQAETARKLSTNLHYLYRKGNLAGIADQRIGRGWVDSVFLALDRLVEDRLLSGQGTSTGQYASVLSASEFADLGGPPNLEKKLATGHLMRLYAACGGRDRFDDEQVQRRIAVMREGAQPQIPNDQRPRGALHASNPRLLKSIPWLCSPLAAAAGFRVLDPEQLAQFDDKSFIRADTRAALATLRDEGIEPTMTAEELTRLTRDQ